MIHDYTRCQNTDCLMCEAHIAGYLDGKAKAHLEVRNRHRSRHSGDYSCEP